MGAEITGQWPISKLDRLADQLAGDDGELSALLTLGKQGPVFFMRGSVSVTFQVICQRCMQVMDLPLSVEINLALITDQSQEDKLPEDFESLLVEEGKVSLPDILQDELLLAMPLVPMHDTDCSEYLQQQAKRQAVEAEQEKAEKEKTKSFFST